MLENLRDESNSKRSIPPEITQSIIKKISRFGDHQKLADYLLQCVHYLSPKEGHKTKNVSECVSDYINSNRSSRLRISLNGTSTFDKFSEQFFMTEGLHVVAGPTGHGKTHWALEWARHIAYANKKTLFLSYEMTFDDIASREIAYQTGLSFKDVQAMNLNETQKLLVKSLFESEKPSLLKNIEVIRMGSLDWKQGEAYFYDRFYKLKPSLVIVDYIQMLEHSGIEEEMKHRMFGKLAREFKMIADEHACAFIICSQLNRKSIDDLKRLKLDDLSYYPLGNEAIKESGGIAEAADSVQMICIPEKFENCPYHLRGLFQVNVDKNRKTGTFPKMLFPFIKEEMRFI